jgi:cystathionine gamma-lyase
MRFETLAVHAGQSPDPATGSVTVPLYQTATFQQRAIGVHRGYEYSRTGNPTRAALEESLAALEQGTHALAFASGCAATMAVFSLLRPSDHILCGEDVYGGTYRILQRIISPLGITVEFVPEDAPESFAQRITPQTKMVWIESPTNPLLRVLDIREIARITARRGVLLVVDNTFASPFLQRPLELGADIVVHSTTKYLAGHSDCVGGAVITNNKQVYQAMKFYQNAAGAVPGILDTWLVLRGVKTLALRMREHSHNALQIAQFLAAHPYVQRVHYPGLSQHPGYETAKRQMYGFGGMLSFELAEGFPAAERLVQALRIFTLAESLGGVESLVCHPARMTHASLPPEERRRRGITDNLVRLSVGVEDVEDLIADLRQALQLAAEGDQATYDI